MARPACVIIDTNVAADSGWSVGGRKFRFSPPGDPYEKLTEVSPPPERGADTCWKSLADDPYRSRVVGAGSLQSRTSPPSTTRFWPVTARAHGEAKNRVASANSVGVVTLRSGVAAAM